MNKYSLIFPLLLIVPSIANAATYNESVNGELAASGGPFITINSTYTTISGTVGSGDSDFFLTQVGAGETLNSMTLTAAAGANATVSLFDGTTMSSPSLFGGNPVWNTSNIGNNFLVTFGSGAISPATTKQYLLGFWHNNTAAISYTLTLNFTTLLPPAAISAPILNLKERPTVFTTEQ